MIPLLEPSLQGNELEYVEECIKTGWISYAGKYITKLEEMIKEYTGAKYAVAVVSGTAAIEMALRVAGVKHDDEVIVPTVTFVATINAIKHVGAHPVFMDCDESLNLDWIKVVKFIEEECTFKDRNLINNNTGRKVKVILPVHVLGNLAEIAGLKKIAAENNLLIVEDAAEALGTWCTAGSEQGKHAGLIGDIGIFSFSFNKTITAGGGGMIITDDEEMAKKAKYLSLQAKDDPVFYIHNEVGYNIGMTNISAAIAVAQMEKLEDILLKKEKIYLRYEEKLSEVRGVEVISSRCGQKANYWLNGIILDPVKFGMDKKRLWSALADKGIQTRPLWGLNHLQKPFVNEQTYLIEKAPGYFEQVLNIPSGTTLTEEQQDFVINTIKELGK